MENIEGILDKNTIPSNKLENKEYLFLVKSFEGKYDYFTITFPAGVDKNKVYLERPLTKVLNKKDPGLSLHLEGVLKKEPYSSNIEVLMVDLSSVNILNPTEENVKRTLYLLGYHQHLDRLAGEVMTKYI